MDKVEELIKETIKAKFNLEEAEYGDDLDENGNDVGLYFLEKAKRLAETHDIRGLYLLLDYFDEKFDLEYEGVLERIQNEIGANFKLDQILEAFYEKFDQMLKKNISRATYFSYWFLSNEMFEGFRKMFNEVRSSKSEEFLERLSSWCNGDYEEEQSILREDMKKW